jgi:hypothetical protein
MTRHEVRAWLVEFLLDKVREDRYPSPTHLALIEKRISRDRVPEYLRVLIDKVEQDTFPEHPHAPPHPARGRVPAALRTRVLTRTGRRWNSRRDDRASRKGSDTLCVVIEPARTRHCRRQPNTDQRTATRN